MSIKKEELTPELEQVRSFTQENLGKNELIAVFSSARGKEIAITADADEAMAMVLGKEHVEITEQANKKVLRKIDFFLIPLIGLLYAFQFMDKTTTSYAAVMGFKKDFHMVGTMYSWCGSAFYLGYLLFEFPANALLQRFPLSKTISAFIVLWGMILCLHAVPTNYAGIITLRVVLGMLESAVTPAMVLLTSQWYKQEEQFLRTAFWFSCNGLGIIIGGGIAYGVAEHSHSYSVEGWRILFIVTGLMTIVTGILFFLHVPDTPSKAWFLTEEEKIIHVERIRSNQQGYGNKHFKKHQFIEALTDINTWLFFAYAIANNIPNGALTNFASILLNSDFGFTPKQSLYMNMPTGGVEFVGCILLAWSVRFFKHRMAISIFAMVIALMGSCLLAFHHNKHVRLAGYYVMYVYPVTTICALSCFASNTAGHTKKISTNAIFLIGYCVGNLIGPQTFISKQAPTYTGGKISFVICDAFSILFLALIYLNYWRLNKKKEKDLAVMDLSELKQHDNLEFADLTDFENPYFRYSL
ncbi:hypothetical protein PUMCH_002454 [Australozyma saopauloensis]|uniref:Major facilitator superfamily (MFS) profile domain-containing protein n=1 Tax=Australozyma saopauloensis TaxID=291208 RepID=A0AAX4H9B9_9ASCO|nr:hypothetical protein PUMCH_002454 [[Candida] saopauloensis]